MIEWISVKDRLPEARPNKYVLVICTSYKGQYNPIYQVQAVLAKGGRLRYKDINEGDYVNEKCVTHWAEINLPLDGSSWGRDAHIEK